MGERFLLSEPGGPQDPLWAARALVPRATEFVARESGSLERQDCGRRVADFEAPPKAVMMIGPVPARPELAVQMQLPGLGQERAAAKNAPSAR